MEIRGMRGQGIEYKVKHTVKQWMIRWIIDILHLNFWPDQRLNKHALNLLVILYFTL